MSNERKDYILRMCKRYGNAVTARHLVTTEGMTYTQAINYLAQIVPAKHMSKRAKQYELAFLNN